MPLSQDLSKNSSMEEINNHDVSVEGLTLSSRDLLVLDEIACSLRKQLLNINVITLTEEDCKKINFLMLFLDQLRQLILGITIKQEKENLDCTGKVLDQIGYEQFDKTLNRNIVKTGPVVSDAERREYDSFFSKVSKSRQDPHNEFKYSKELGEFINTYSRIIRKGAGLY